MKKIAITIFIMMAFTLSGYANSAEDYFFQGFNAEDASNFRKASKFYKKACDSGYGKGCFYLGNLYAFGHGVKKSDSKAKEFYESSCDSGYVHGCVFVGTVYKGEAKEFYEKACNAGSKEGCVLLGYLYVFGQGVKQNYVKANEIFRKACYSSNGYWCIPLGSSYEYGQGVIRNYLKAKALYKMACDGGVVNGCKKYSRLNKEGK